MPALFVLCAENYVRFLKSAIVFVTLGVSFKNTADGYGCAYRRIVVGEFVLALPAELNSA